MYSVTKQFEFSAAHALTRYKGKCEYLHGHNYVVEVKVSGKLNQDDMVIDFTELKKIAQEHIISKLDHTNLNDQFENPSCEVLAKWIFDEMKRHIAIAEVKLWETPTSCVIYNEN